MRPLARVYELVRRRRAPRWLREAGLCRLVWKTVRKVINVCIIPCIPFNSVRILGYRLIGFKVGRRAFIGMRCYLDDYEPRNTIIEDNVTVSYGVVFAAHGAGLRKTAIVLREKCYIGANSTILGGADIGRCALVGAGSLVNKPVAPFTVVAGVPAKTIRNCPPPGTAQYNIYVRETGEHPGADQEPAGAAGANETGPSTPPPGGTQTPAGSDTGGSCDDGEKPSQTVAKEDMSVPKETPRLHAPGGGEIRAGTGDGQLPFVSAVVPMYNEEQYIGQFLEAMLAQDYLRDRFEVLLIDGGSTDRTAEIAQSMAREHPVFRLLENPERFLPQGENLGIQNASGDVIARMDVHAGYGPEYLTSCVEALQSTGAWGVGGLLRTEPGAGTHVAQAIAIVQSHIFGVGNSQARIGKEACEVDGLAFPCLWRWVFEKVGLYHELMPRHEDVEFYSRVRRAGGNLMVVPSVRATYYARPTLWRLLKQAWATGYETPMAFLASPGCTRLRHWVPGVFVATLILAGVAALFSPPAQWLLAFVVGAYLVAVGVMSVDVGRRRGWVHAPLAALVFALHHLGYGLGSVAGLFSLPWAYFRLRTYKTPALDGDRAPSKPDVAV